MCPHNVKATSLKRLGDGDISEVLALAMTKAVSISAPTFFATNTALFQDNIAAIQFGFSGVSVSPCAIPIVPIGIGIFPQVWRPDLAAGDLDDAVLQAPCTWLPWPLRGEMSTTLVVPWD